MPSIKTWCRAARLRTLPLAVSGIITGAVASAFDGAFNGVVSILALLTAIMLQVLSNFANDYGDAQKGTDNNDRVGPERAIQSGEVSPIQMKYAMYVSGVIAFVSGIILITVGTQGMPREGWFAFLGLGLLSIAAAVMYTVGRKPYGYMALGDLMVFLFFGIVAVMGSYYLNTHTWSWSAMLLAVTIGLCSTGVLNLNNMRDIENDLASGKRTLAALLGLRVAKIYHVVLIILASAMLIYYGVLYQFGYRFLIICPVLIFFVFDLKQIWQTKKNAQLDPFLKRLAIATFGVSLSLIIALLV